MALDWYNAMMSSQELHPIISTIAERYLHIDKENEKGGPRLKPHEIPFESVDLGDVDARLTDFAEAVNGRYNSLLARWTGNVAVANVASIVTDYRQATPLPHPDRRGRTVLAVQAERYGATFGFIFQADGSIRPPRTILKIDATLPIHEPELMTLTHSAKQRNLMKLRRLRYERLHQVDQVTAALDMTLDLR